MAKERFRREQHNTPNRNAPLAPGSTGGSPTATQSAAPPDRKVKGTIHWVSAQHAITAPVRLYDHLFSTPDPDEAPAGQTHLANLNPNSLEVLTAARLEPSLATAQPGDRFQFERSGYFCADAIDSQPGKPVFNRTVTLKDTWAKIEQKTGR